MDVEKIRADFPILEKVTYLDSAATSQRPNQVIESISEFYRDKNTNVERGLYKLAEEATLAYSEVREKAARFVGAGKNEIIFTRNTTESLNLVMRGWGEKNVKKGDKIVTTILEHHSNFVPWQVLAKKRGASFGVVGIGGQCELDESDLEKKIKGANLVAVSAASNVAGTIPDVKKICRMAHEEGAICVVDAAQLVPSRPVDVKSIGCDFLTFSGHKMLGPFGAGVLYGKEGLLESMDPFMYGSEMIRSVNTESAEWNGLPHKFESGTPDVAAVIGFGAALDYLNSIGMENVQSYEEGLTSYLYERLDEVDGLEIIGPEKRAGLVAFTLGNAHPHDIAAMLDEDNIAVRSGHHCAMPLHEHLGIPASTRASIYIYNRKEEIDKLAESLEKVRKIFG
jgi:cysteine desulfurase/selenocysteine lyase